MTEGLIFDYGVMFESLEVAYFGRSKVGVLTIANILAYKRYFEP
jgi:hypothetical protein